VVERRRAMVCDYEDGLIIPALPYDIYCSAGGVIFYMFFLLWSFLGVALIADIFMCAIERITSKETRVMASVHKEVGSDETVEREFTVKVWNDTVANLTLMALGSSAPEILLSVIEILSNDFYAGELGPSTIVGSAAFNLFIILAVCVMAIPAGETRTIMDINVFYITAGASIISYVWLLFILVVSSPDIITIWEGVITFLMFPALVILAWMADAKKFCFDDSDRQLHSKLLEVRGPDGQPITQEKLIMLAKIVKAKYGSNLTAERSAMLVAREASKHLQKRSRAYYRVQATRGITGSEHVVEHELPATPREDAKVAPAGVEDIKDAEESTGAMPTMGKMDAGDVHDAFPTDYAGMLAFEIDELLVDEGVGSVSLKVIRKHGCHGAVSCSWTTKDDTAVAPSDYTAASGQLKFASGETSQTITIEIKDDNSAEGEEQFFVEINSCTDNCSFDPTTDGSEEKCIAKVRLKDDDELQMTWVQKMMPFLAVDRDQMDLGHAEYGGQFTAALYANGGEELKAEDGSVVPPTVLEYVLHAFSLVWKLAFAIVPPVRFCGGWLTFGVALCFIGGLTAIIGDVATHMGAAMGLKSTVTAITFVALGTSLPDTFASKTAAVQDAGADNAIGNVTGSNAVNVFLGLGMPWLIAAIYWSDPSAEDKGKWLAKYCGPFPSKVESALSACPTSFAGDIGFAVPAGDLGVSVGVFVGGACAAVAVLMVRRAKYAAELGGPETPKKVTAVFFIFLWAVYVGVSVYMAYK